MGPSLTEQYNIFKLEQMEVERMATQDSDNTMDMAGYAEFQRQFKGLKEAHRQVLFAIRAFWQSLTRSDIQYTTLVGHFGKIGKSQALVRGRYMPKHHYLPCRMHMKVVCNDVNAFCCVQIITQRKQE